jgi:hypothetical protein
MPVDSQDPLDVAYTEGRLHGLKDGKEVAKQQVLTWLEKEYLKPTTKRGTAPALAMLELARRLSQELTIE